MGDGEENAYAQEPGAVPVQESIEESDGARELRETLEAITQRNQMDVTGFGDLVAETLANRKKGYASKSTDPFGWKYASECREFLEAAMKSGQIKPGDLVPASAILAGLQRNGIALSLKSPKAIGDACGGHGLKLMRGAGNCFLIPKELPILNPDWTMKPAVYDLAGVSIQKNEAMAS